MLIPPDQMRNCMIFVDSAEPQKIAEIADIAEMAEIPNAGFYMYPSDKSVIDGIDYMTRCDIQAKEDSDHVIPERYAWYALPVGMIVMEPIVGIDKTMNKIIRDI